MEQQGRWEQASTRTVTLLFTDIEGSTRRWEGMPEAMRVALARHDAILRDAIGGAGGEVFKTVGDAFLAVFDEVPEAVAAALDAQRALHAQDWGELQSLPVRMAIHVGSVEARDGDYFGPPLNRTARLLAVGYGGQILLSQGAQALLEGLPLPGVTLLDLGEHRLRDLTRAEHIFQVLHADLPAKFPPLKSLDSLPTNLPSQVTSFVGREQALAEVKELLGTVRVLTLLGAGGTGKTRLAFQVAADVLDAYPDGVRVAELEALEDPAFVAPTIAVALGVRETPGQPLTTTITEHLRAKKLLLVLDNCEHVISTCAPLVAGLLRTCPELRVLCTSREALGIGETVWRVPSLKVPNLRRLPPLEELAELDSVRLFVDRATVASPSFRLTPQNAPSVAQICYRLDGIPLAIELAAARVKLLTPEQIASRLDDRFRLLTGGSRGALPRQQTLRALIDWSHGLLGEPERVLWRRLSVFSGGWTLDSAEAVVPDDALGGYLGPAGAPAPNGAGVSGALSDADVLDALGQLIDKSLVVAEEQDSIPRYRLLETIREYGTNRLDESGEAAAVRECHRDWCLKLAEEAEPALAGPQQASWFERLEAEHDNFRVALRWSLDQGAAEPGLRLAVALWRFWNVRGYLTDGRRQLSDFIALQPDQRTVLQAKALNRAGGLAWQQGDYAAARDFYERSLAICREVDDKRGAAMALTNLGLVARTQGDLDAARKVYEESLEVFRQLDDRASAAGALNALGNVALHQNDYALARRLYQESRDLQRALGNRNGLAMALTNLGEVARAEGDLEAAGAHYQEGLAIQRELGNRAGIANTLHNLGEVALTKGDLATARPLFEEALATSRELGNRRLVAASLGNLGEVARIQGDYAAAQSHYEESLTIWRELGDRRNIAVVLFNLASTETERQAFEEARALLEESLSIRWVLGDKRGMAESLEGFAALAAAQSHAERSVRLASIADVVRESLGATLTPLERSSREHWLEPARLALGPGVATICAEARTMPLEEAIAYAVDDAG